MANRTNDKLIDALNRLIIINNDRYEGYTTAAKESSDVDLDTQFYASANKSKSYAGKITQYVRELGGEPAEGTNNTGKLYRIWMDIKAAVVSKDRQAILSSCEFGEDTALKEYAEVREDISLDIPVDYMSTIKFQEAEIRMDHDSIKNMLELEKTVSNA